MIEHLQNEWPRYVGLIEMVVLISCFIGIHHGSKPVLPRVTYFAGWGILYVLTCVAAALVVNVTSPDPPTEGVRFMVFVLSPAVIGGVVAVVMTARENNGRRDP